MTGNKVAEESVNHKLLELLKAHPNIEVFEVFVADLNGRLRGKWIPRSTIKKAFNGGLKLPLSTLAFDIWGRDPLESVYEYGDEDGICVAQSRSLAIVPWLKKPTAQVIMSLAHMSGEPCGYDPREIVKRVSARFSKRGFTPVLATEMEFYLLKNEFDDNGRPVHTQTSHDGQAALGGQTYGIDAMQDVAHIMHDIRTACEAQNLPIDTLITEASPSQYEINLYHQADALLAADQGMLLQRAIKGVARQHNLLATFMAKPFSDQAGNGMHVHCSVQDSAGKNAFNNDTDAGNDLLRYAVAGCLDSLSDCMLLFAPNLNSYRRLLPDSHAPTAPNWGYENRTTAIRIPAGDHRAMRIEHRIAGADANPHLVVAAILAGMIHGLENQLEPPEPIVGDAYQQCKPSLPNSWQEAIERFDSSTFVREYLGAEFQKMYAETKRQEFSEFQKHITPLEYRSYL